MTRTENAPGKLLLLARATLVATAVALVLLAAGSSPPPAAAQGQDEPTFRDQPTDGAWVGSMRFGNRELPLQINANTYEGGGVVHVLLPEDLGADEPGQLGLHTAVETAIGTQANDDGDDDDGDDDDFDPDDDDDCCYGGDSQAETDESHDDGDGAHLRFMVQIAADEDVNDDGVVDPQDVYEREFDLAHEAEDDVLRGRVTSTRPGERNGRVELLRMSPDRPLQRLWTGTANVDGSGRGDVTLLLTQDAPTAFPQVTEKMTAGVTGRVWFDGRTGTIAMGELDDNDLTATVDLPGTADIDLSARLIRRNTRMRARFDGRGGLMRPASTRGKPMSLRRVVDDEVTVGQRTTVRLRGRNLEEGVLVHFGDPAVRTVSVNLRNPRLMDVVVEVDADADTDASVSLLVVNVDGQEDDEREAIALTEGDTAQTTVSFSADVQPIFTTNCALAGCHSSASARAGQSLAAGEAYDNIVGVPSTEQPQLLRIDPGNPDDSYLVKKIRGDADISGARMPFQRAPLSQSDIDTIITWVREGARRN